MPSSDMCSLLVVEILHLSELEFSTESWFKNESLTITYLLSLFISCQKFISYCSEINFTSIWWHTHRLSFDSIIENSKLVGYGMFQWAEQAILVNWVKVKPHPSPPPPSLPDPSCTIHFTVWHIYFGHDCEPVNLDHDPDRQKGWNETERKPTRGWRYKRQCLILNLLLIQ